MTVINIRAILRGEKEIVFRAEATRVRASGVERKKETSPNAGFARPGSLVLGPAAVAVAGRATDGGD